MRLFKSLLLLLAIIIPGFLSAQFSDEYINHKWLADSLYKKGNYVFAASEYRKICELKDVQRSDYYWASCCYCKLNKADSALDFLTIGAKLGMLFEGGTDDIDNDKNLIPLRSLKGWRNTRSILIRNDSSLDQFDSLRLVLFNMEFMDQNIRHAKWDSLNKHQKDSITDREIKFDKDNQAALKKIIAKVGWPGFKLVGMHGASIAWLIAQHSDEDTAFQNQCLKLLRQAVKNRDALLQNLAYLEDRVLANEGKPQIYGTQFKTEVTPDGKKLVPRLISDEKNVDKRRIAVGLNTIEDYINSSAKYMGYTK